MFNRRSWGSDISGDGIVDVSDYIGIANIILTGSIYGNANSRTDCLPKEEDKYRAGVISIADKYYLI